MKNKRVIRRRENKDYDSKDTSTLIDASKRLKFEDLDLKLSASLPTQVVSIRLPSELLNQVKAIASQRDVPYQALIKLFLSDSVAERKRRY